MEFQCSFFVSFLFHPMHLTEEPWTLEELMGAIGKLQINKSADGCGFIAPFCKYIVASFASNILP